MSDPNIAEYLLRWEQAFALGEDLSPEQLCADQPELVAKVRPFVEMMRTLRRGVEPGPATQGTDSYHSPPTLDNRPTDPHESQGMLGAPQNVGQAPAFQKGIVFIL